MKYYKGAWGFIQQLQILKPNGDPEDLSGKTITKLLLEDLRNSGTYKTLTTITITDPGNGELEFTQDDPAKFDTVTEYKIQAEITDDSSTYLRYTEPGIIVIMKPAQA